jgi:hypothetical protein
MTVCAGFDKALPDDFVVRTVALDSNSIVRTNVLRARTLFDHTLRDRHATSATATTTTTRRAHARANRPPRPPRVARRRRASAHQQVRAPPLLSALPPSVMSTRAASKSAPKSKLTTVKKALAPVSGAKVSVL